MDREIIAHGILSNRMRLVTITVPNSIVEYSGIGVNVGSSYESLQEEGLAHFVEHTIFKGTSRHSASYILNCMELVGGELNAFTNKEETIIYTIAPKGYFLKSSKLLSEIVSDSVFPEKEIDKEKSVVCDEIDSYLDTPSDAIFDELDERLFKGTCYAHNILGNKKSVRNFTSEDCKEWLKKYFTTDNSVFFYSGPMSYHEVESKIEKIFGGYRTAKSPDKIKTSKVEDKIFNEVINIGNLHQSHVAMAFRIPGIDSRYQPELLLLSNILGGPGMNSRLNMALREKKGLVYNVETSTSLYSDIGSFVIYYGCDHEDENLCRKLVNCELNKVNERSFSQRELDRYRSQYLGQLTVALDSREHSIMSAARSMLCRNRILTKKDVEEKIMGITPSSLQEAAKFISPELMSSLTIR